MTVHSGAQYRRRPPGRLGDPDRSLGTDPRVDPGVVAALAPFGLDAHASVPPVDPRTPLPELLEFAGAAEAGFERVFEVMLGGLPEVQGVESETHTVIAADDHEIGLHVTRPVGMREPLPCVYHIHGGAMAVMGTTNAVYERWRRELAATGLVVVGVEFRNAAGRLGSHPYPAGLEDCAAGLKWVREHRADFDVSNIVVSGDSGGANLALALAIKAKREGFLPSISGVYAQCPYIHGAWGPGSELRFPSLAENDGYFMNREVMQIFAEIYDPGSRNSGEATCWPSQATTADLEGLPPHVISVNEVDPLRDEGLEYYRNLLAAGVRTIGRMNLGLCHTGEIFFRATMPEIYTETIRSISSFAYSLR